MRRVTLPSDAEPAVLEDGVRTPGQFAAWLEQRARAVDPRR